MFDIIKQFGVTGLAVLATFYLIRDVLGPLVKAANRRWSAQPEQPGRIELIEHDVRSLGERADEFQKSLDDSGVAIDNKMDMILQELKEMRQEFGEKLFQLAERTKGTEKDIEHLLKRHSH